MPSRLDVDMSEEYDTFSNGYIASISAFHANFYVNFRRGESRKSFVRRFLELLWSESERYIPENPDIRDSHDVRRNSFEEFKNRVNSTIDMLEDVRAIGPSPVQLSIACDYVLTLVAPPRSYCRCVDKDNSHKSTHQQYLWLLSTAIVATVIVATVSTPHDYPRSRA